MKTLVPALMEGGAISLAFPWVDPTSATSDLFHICGINGASVPTNVYGTQYPYLGDSAYAGVGTYVKNSSDFREYIQVKLNDTLEAGKTYYVRFYISKAENVQYASNGMSAYFSDTAISCSFCFLNYAPQINYNDTIIKDTINWVPISGSFVAAGGEKYMTIGNFNSDANTDTLLVNSSSFIVAAVYYIDDVYVGETPAPVGVKGLEINDEGFEIYPNPAIDVININIQNPKMKYQQAQIEITDLTGRLIIKKQIKNSSNHIAIDISIFSKGIYFITLKTKEGLYTEKFIKNN